jgi:hypothetical protein
MAFRTATLLTLLAALLAAALPGHAQDSVDEALERRVKAAFLYRFLEYVTWPDPAFARPDSPVVLGVLGAEAIAAEVQQVVAGRTVGGRPVAVRALREGEPLAGLHALFIGQSANARLAQIAKAVPGAVLIVTEAENGLTQGGVINFLIAEGRVRFEVGLRGAERRTLRLSARLLSVALNVRKDSMRPPFADVVARLLPRLSFELLLPSIR